MNRMFRRLGVALAIIAAFVHGAAHAQPSVGPVGQQALPAGPATSLLTANAGGGQAATSTFTAYLDSVYGTSNAVGVGDLLVRTSTGWGLLPTGTTGYVLTAQGTGALPTYNALSGTYTLPAATTSSLGGIEVNAASFSINGSGVLSPVFGTGAGTAGAFIQATDARVVNALTSAAIPATGGLLGTSGTAGAASAITVGPTLSLVGGTLNVAASTSATVAAAGATGPTATALTGTFADVTSGTGGVILPPFVVNVTYQVANDTSAAIKVYPQAASTFTAVQSSGAAATAVAAGGPVLVQPGVVATFQPTTSTNARVY